MQSKLLVMPYNALRDLALPTTLSSFSCTFSPAHLSLAMLKPLLLPQQGKLMTIPPLLPLSFSLRFSYDSLSFIQLCLQMTPLRKSSSNHMKKKNTFPTPPPYHYSLSSCLASLFFYNTYQNLASVYITLILYLFFQNVTLLFVTSSFSSFLSRMLHSKERKQTCLSSSL